MQDISKHWKKLLATLIVSSFFIFFWVNGPIAVEPVLEQLNVEETPFSKPKMVGDSAGHSKFGAIDEAETEGHGWRLVLDKKKDISAFGRIGGEGHVNIFSEEYQKDLLHHAKDILNGGILVRKHPLSHGLVFELDWEGQRVFYTENILAESHIRGYAGPIQLGLVFDEDAKLMKVQHLKSKETQSYLSKIANAGYYQQYTQMEMEGDHDLDAVSGATITSQAMAQVTANIVQGIGEELNSYLDEERMMTGFTAQAFNTLWWIAHVLVVLIMFLYGFQKKFKKTKTGIRVLSISSVVYIGFFMNSSFTYVSFLHPFMGTILSPFIAFFALFSLLGAIWGRNLYCSYVCPFGHAQRLVLDVSNKSFVGKLKIKNKHLEWVRNILTVGLIVGVVLGMRSWSNFEVFPDLFDPNFLSPWFFITVAILLVNLRYPFIWCRVACPTGAVLDGVAKVCK